MCRRGRAGGGDRIAIGPDRLLLEWLLLRGGLRPALGGPVSGRLACLGPPVECRLDSARRRSHSLPVHPTQLYASLAGFAVLGLLLAYFPRRRGPAR